VRAIAGDANGYIWVGTWNDNRIHKIDPLQCKTIADYPLPGGANPYGFAVDRNGLLWISSPNGTQYPLNSFDTNTGKVVDKVSKPYNTYGVVVDGTNDAWFAAWCTNHLLRIDAKTKAMSNITMPSFDGNWCARGMAVDTDGNVWAAVAAYNANACSNASYLVKYNKNGTHIGNYKMPANFGGGAMGVSMDAGGKIWVTSVCTDTAARVNKDTGAVELVAPLYGTNPYTYSDWTGAMLKNVTTNNGQIGTWTANFDGTTTTSTWQQATFEAEKPAGTNVRVRFRAAAAIEAIEGSPWCVPDPTPPIDLTKCNFGAKRWLQVEMYLLTNDVNVQPKVDNFKVYWQK
jgi:streptogramin lyase